MDIGQIRSLNDLLNFYRLRDKNKNGKIDLNEYDEVAMYDKNGDHVLSPWEVMEAANRIQGKIVFDRATIRSAREKDGSYDNICLNLDRAATINQVPLNAGEKICINMREFRISEAVPFSRIWLNHYLVMSGTPVSFHANGKIGAFKIEVSASLPGRPFLGRNRDSFILPPGSEVRFSENGLLDRVIISNAVRFNKITFPKGSEIDFAANGRISKLYLPDKSTLSVDGIEYINPISHPGIEETRVPIAFHPNGRIKHACITQEEEASLHPPRFKGPILFGNGETTFLEDGKVISGSLADTTILQGYPLYDLIEFHRNGKIKEGILAEPHPIYGISFPKDTSVLFDNKGRVLSVKPPETFILNGFKFESNTEISFDRKGNIISGSLTGDFPAGGTDRLGNKFKIVYQARQNVGFFDFNKRDISGGVLKHPVTIAGIKFAADYWLGFYQTDDEVERVYQGALAEKCEIDGKTYPAGTRLLFHYNGKVKKVITGND